LYARGCAFCWDFLLLLDVFSLKAGYTHTHSTQTHHTHTHTHTPKRAALTKCLLMPWLCLTLLHVILLSV